MRIITDSRLPDICTDDDVIKVQFIDDENTLICHVAVLQENGLDIRIPVLCEKIHIFLNAIEKHKIQYHFVFDSSCLNCIPLHFAKQLHRVILEHRLTIRKYLHSTVVILKYKTTQNIFNTIFKVVPAMKPVKFIVRSSTNSNSSCEKDTITFLRKTRNEDKAPNIDKKLISYDPAPV